VTRLVAVATCLSLILSSVPSFALDKEQCVAASESAQKLRTQKKLRAARKELITCAQEACPAIVKKDCLTWVAEVEESLPTVVISAKDASGNELTDVRVSVDGEQLADKLDGTAIAVDPGMHTFRYETAGAAPVESKVLVHEAERNRTLTVTIGNKPAPPPSPPSPVAPQPQPPVDTGERSSSIPTGAWVFGAVSLVSFAGFAYFGLSGRADKQKLIEECAPYCNKDDEQPARTKFILADVSLGVGIVSLGVATVFLLTGKNEPKHSAVRVDVVPVASGGAALFTGSF